MLWLNKKQQQSMAFLKQLRLSTNVILQCEQSYLTPIMKSNHHMFDTVNIVPIHVTANKPFHFNDF